MHESSLRVLHLIDSLSLGGAERMAVNICNELASRGHNVHLCASRFGGPLDAALSPAVRFFILGRTSKFDMAAVLRLSRYVRTERIQIAHAHSSSFFLAVLLKLFTGIKIVWHDHYGGGKRKADFSTWILRICSRAFAWSIAVNEDLLFWARANLPSLGGCITYLPNFPDLGAPAPDPLELPGNRSSRIVCAARLHPQKDQLTLVRAMRQVTAVRPDAVLFLVGHDSGDAYARSVRSLIEEFGLLESIYVLGARTDVADILAQCSLGVLSSRSEGLPVALLEYGLAGLPVVCTDVGDCGRVLGAGKYGVLVPPSDADSLARGITEIMSDCELRVTLARSFKKHVAENYSKTRACTELLEVYKAVSGG